MKRYTMVVALAVLVLAASATPAIAALTIDHAAVGSAVNPASSVLMQTTSGYKAKSCTGCHTSQAGQILGAHGLYLRPVPATGSAGNVSNNPYLGQLSGADFVIGDADWLIGGLTIGAERYIFDKSASTLSTTAVWPQIGNRQWMMDWPTVAKTAAPLMPSSETTAWKSYSGVNYFTGIAVNTGTGAGLKEGPNEYGCIRCHSYGAAYGAEVVTGVPSVYTVEEWGVTCANCHKSTSSASHSFGPRFSSDSCRTCHQRDPVAASADTSGRAQQLDQTIWDNGMSGRHRDQGYEFEKPKIAGTFVAGTVETSGGVGHPESYAAIVTIGQGSNHFCMRCHTTQGYIAHAEMDTDVPYSWTTETALGNLKTYTVDPATAVGVSCVACHRTHGTETALNTFSRRASSDMEACADCHRVSNLTMVVATSTATKIPTDDTRVSHPTREVYFGFGGYGVDDLESLHYGLNVTCQSCHMAVSTTEPEGDSSHLFKVVMPSQAATMGQNRFTAAASAASSTPSRASAVFPDDSCTGFGCHLATASTRQWLQDVITLRQTVVKNKVDQAAAAMTAANVASLTLDWKKARTNYLMAKNDGSYGVHNYYYTRTLLDYSIREFGRLRALPKAYVGIPGTSSTWRRWRTMSVSGILAPRRTAGAVSVVLRFERRVGTRWVLTKSVSARNYNYGDHTRYAASASLPYTGAWRVRAYFAIDGTYASAFSAYRNITVVP